MGHHFSWLIPFLFHTMLPLGCGGLAATFLSLPVFSPFHVLSDLADPPWWVAPVIA